MLKQKRRRLEPLRKIGARMKKARSENDAVKIGEPVNITTMEERNSEPTVNTTIRTPEHIPPATFSSPESEQSPSVMSHAAIEIKTIYKLETLTLEEEQSLGKLELDNKMNDNKRKRNLNSLLSEQRVQGAFQILKFVSTESKALIDQLKPCPLNPRL